MSATCCMVALSSTHRTILLTWSSQSCVRASPWYHAVRERSNQLPGIRRAFAAVGASVRAPCRRHHTPLHLAARGGRRRVAPASPATELKVEHAAAPRAGRSRGRLLRDREGRKARTPRRSPQEIAAAFTPTAAARERDRRRPVRELPRRSRRRVPLARRCRAARSPDAATAYGAGKTICIDYSSPNISKHLAYHHIRGTTIGHALAQIFRALGYRVVGINFLGDWGTTHGMLLAAYEMWGAPAIDRSTSRRSTSCT